MNTGMKMAAGLMAAAAMAAMAYAAADDLAVAESLENAFVRVADKVGPAVVSISASQEQSFQVRYHEDPAVDELLRHLYGMPSKPMKLQRRGLGSGMIISKKGDILTNAHVVQYADKIVVTLADGRQYTCEVRGSDPRSELAVIRITNRKDTDAELPVVTLGDSDAVKPGHWSIAVGNPFGITEESDDQPTLTVGVVSAIRTFETPMKDFSKMIQTDAAINPGNSGGPLCNIKGEVVGINTFIVSAGSPQNAGISFAIPINSAKAVLANLTEGREIAYGWLGIEMQPVDDAMAEFFGLDAPRGVLVGEVVPGGPAQKAGVKAGDLLTNVNRIQITDPGHLLKVITHLGVGKQVPLVVTREKKELTFTATVGKRPTEGGFHTQGVGAAWRGITVRDLPANDPQFADRKGVVIESVEEQSAGAKAGLAPGTVITSVGAKAVGSAAEFGEAVKKINGPVLVRTEQGFVVVKGERDRPH